MQDGFPFPVTSKTVLPNCFDNPLRAAEFSCFLEVGATGSLDFLRRAGEQRAHAVN